MMLTPYSISHGAPLRQYLFKHPLRRISEKRRLFQKVSLSLAVTAKSSSSAETTGRNIVIAKPAKRLVRYKTNVILDAENV